MGQIQDSRRVILVVDDQSDNRELLNVFLSGLGYFVIEACNGLEAVKLATSDCPDLILMDLSMPVMDGFNAFGFCGKCRQPALSRSWLAPHTTRLLTKFRRFA